MQWVDEMEDEKKKLKLNNNKKKIKTRVSQAWYQKLAVSARLGRARLTDFSTSHQTIQNTPGVFEDLVIVVNFFYLAIIRTNYNFSGAS